MMVEIPNQGPLVLGTMVSDFNGTLAVGGKLLAGVRDRLGILAGKMRIVILTADTNGTARVELEGSGAEVLILSAAAVEGEESEQKRQFVEDQKPGVLFLGNGANDEAAMSAADLSFAIIAGEGAYMPTVNAARMVFTSPLDALDVLIHEKRLVSGLRR